MNSGNLSDESDTSDEDYNPDGQTEDLPSEVESDGDPEDDLLPSESSSAKRGKSKQSKRPTKRRKRAKKDTAAVEDSTDETVKELPSNELNEEQKKNKADSLWADFMSDTDFKPKPKSSKTLVESESSNTVGKIACKPIEQPKKVTVTEIFDFAGEQVEVTKEVAAPSSSVPQSDRLETVRRGRAGLGGISSVLSQLGKKPKISTLEKSKLDWDSFKREENIDEDIKRHNKGKDEYLERQDFLERADLRRFEIEKELRTCKEIIE